MFSTLPHKPICLIVYNSETKARFICGPYCAIESRKTIPLHIVDDVIEGSQVWAGLSPALASDMRESVQAALAGMDMRKTGGDMAGVQSPTDTSNDLLHISAYYFDGEARGGMTHSRRLKPLKQSDTILMFMLSLHHNTDERTNPTKAEATLAASLAPHIVPGNKLDIEIERRTGLFDSFAAAANHGKGALTLMYLSDGECGVWDWCKESLPGQYVCGVYNKRLGNVKALAIVRKVAVSWTSVSCEKITDADVAPVKS